MGAIKRFEVDRMEDDTITLPWVDDPAVALSEQMLEEEIANLNFGGSFGQYAQAMEAVEPTLEDDSVYVTHFVPSTGQVIEGVLNLNH